MSDPTHAPAHTTATLPNLPTLTHPETLHDEDVKHPVMAEHSNRASTINGAGSMEKAHDGIALGLEGSEGAEGKGIEGEGYALEGTTLGTTQLILDTHIVLHPTPSQDPNDPLNWAKGTKYYILGLICYAALLSNWAAAGPSVAIWQLSVTYTGVPPNIAETGYFFSVNALFTGVSNFLWIPLTNKYGRRPILLISIIGYFFCNLWCVLAKSYGVEMSGRIFLGFFAGATECIAPLILTDIFFLHQRGKFLTLYTLFLVLSSAIGIIFVGLLMLKNRYNEFYWTNLGLLGILAILVYFTLPETAYRRVAPDATRQFEGYTKDEVAESSIPLKTRKQKLALFSGTYTSESIWRMAIRPLPLLFLPTVFYATAIYGVTIGFFVALTTNYPVAFSPPPYLYSTTHVSLFYIGNIIAALIAVFIGGWVSDWIVKSLSRRNNGVFEPEFRLIALIPAAIAYPLGLVLYGLGVQNHIKWILPVFGGSLLSFATVIATNVALLLITDVYRPIAGECITAMLGWKAFYTFGVAFSTNPWIAKVGYLDAYGEMAAISAFFFLLGVPLYIWGSRIRQASINWRLTKWVGWDADRDDIAITGCQPHGH